MEPQAQLQEDILPVVAEDPLEEQMLILQELEELVGVAMVAIMVHLLLQKPVLLILAEEAVEMGQVLDLVDPG